MRIPFHCGSEASKVQQPCQFLPNVGAFGLDADKHIQMVVVLVSEKCCLDHGEHAKTFSRHPEAIKSQNYLNSHVVFIQHGEICIEAIENTGHQCLATGSGKEPDWIILWCLYS